MMDYILGVEIGGTKLQLALGSSDGEILAIKKGRVDVSEGGDGIRRWLRTHIPVFISEGKQRFGQVAAIGCGFGGPVNHHEGRVLQSIQIEGWKNFPIRDWFSETFSLPATVDNDSNAAAWGEYCRGFGRGCEYFFYTNIGSGVGGGFILNNKLYDGQGFGAGEFGHTYVPDWTSDIPGKGIKVEQACSGWAIESRLRTPGYVPKSSKLYEILSGELTNVRVHDLAECAQHGDAFSLREIDRVAYSIGLGLANVLCLTNVERIAIGGGVSKLGELLLEPIRQYTREFEFVSCRGRYEISQCELGDDIVLVGAILIAQEILNSA
ncbi:MAG: ROK family protein [Chloroflexota bacterium]|nr:ROK family protein [Chloroflexota bacterium]